MKCSFIERLYRRSQLAGSIGADKPSHRDPTAKELQCLDTYSSSCRLDELLLSGALGVCSGSVGAPPPAKTLVSAVAMLTWIFPSAARFRVNRAISES